MNEIDVELLGKKTLQVEKLHHRQLFVLFLFFSLWSSGFVLFITIWYLSTTIILFLVLELAWRIKRYR